MCSAILRRFHTEGVVSGLYPEFLQRGAKLGIFKKRGAQLQGERALEKKNFVGIFRWGGRLTQGRTNVPFLPPKYTPGFGVPIFNVICFYVQNIELIM